jgi:hypothetical protein
LKAVYHLLVSSAETIGTFNTDFDTVNLHRPTVGLSAAATNTALAAHQGLTHFLFSAYPEHFW